MKLKRWFLVTPLVEVALLAAIAAGVLSLAGIHSYVDVTKLGVTDRIAVVAIIVALLAFLVAYASLRVTIVQTSVLFRHASLSLSVWSQSYNPSETKKVEVSLSIANTGNKASTGFYLFLFVRNQLNWIIGPVGAQSAQPPVDFFVKDFDRGDLEHTGLHRGDLRPGWEDVVYRKYTRFIPGPVFAGMPITVPVWIEAAGKDVEPEKSGSMYWQISSEDGVFPTNGFGRLDNVV